MRTIILTEPDELRRLVNEAVGQALSEKLPKVVRQAQLGEYLTKKELMALTGWSSRQVEYKKSKRAIPYVKRGRTVLFPTDEVLAYLEEGRVPAR